MPVIPQDTFMVAAPIRTEAKASLYQLLGRMNLRPGVVDPANPLLPFQNFHTIHFARFVVLEDQTLSDLAAYHESFPNAPVYLVFLGDCDGPSAHLLQELAREAGSGLREIFSHCEGFGPNIDLLPWMRAHLLRPAANYVNFIGRTVQQIREEAALHTALIQYLAGTSADEPPSRLRSRLRQAVREHGPILGRPGPTPIWFWLRQKCSDLAAGLLLLAGALLLLLTPLILLIPLYLYCLRRHEITDPVVPKPPHDIPSNQYVAGLATLEDYDLVNQFSAFGNVKPGWFRRGTIIFLLFALNFANRLLYGRGRLARIGTIHFARWVFIDGHRRLFFASNYDRSLETYADDFVNKVAFGINLVFSNGIGYPSTRFLILDGAKNERNYQNYLRRHQLPTQVWYNAYPGLTAFDINRNASIRKGLEGDTRSDPEIRQWLALI